MKHTYPNTFETLDFFRGISDRHSIAHPFIKDVRRDRRPKDSSLAFHSIADAWFAERFGIRYRSDSVFLTSRMLSAQSYAASPSHVIRVIPLGPYRYCWSPNISDLLFLAKNYSSEDMNPNSIKTSLDRAEYQENDLAAAHEAGHEVMLHCERYIAIPSALVGEMQSVIAPSTILLHKAY